MLTFQEGSVVRDALAELEKELQDAKKQEEKLDEENKDQNVTHIERFRLRTRQTVALARKEAVEQAISKLRSHLAPINSLPHEILSHVFYLGSEDEHYMRTSSSESEFVLDYSPFRPNRMGLTFRELVSHVCQKWRQVSTSTPGLWHRIVFLIDREKPSSLLRSFSWLGRTKAVPLDITIECSVPLESAKSRFELVWNRLVREASRFKHLRLYLRDVHWVASALARLPDMLKLESLDIRGRKLQRKFTAGTTKADINLLNCSRLRDLRTHGIALDWQSLPFHSITKLAITQQITKDSFPLESLDLVLSELAPTLEWFALSYPLSIAPRTEPTFHPREFSALHTFEIRLPQPTLLREWIQLFTFPVLKRLLLDVPSIEQTPINMILIPPRLFGGRKKSPFETVEELTIPATPDPCLSIGTFIVKTFPSLVKLVCSQGVEGFDYKNLFPALEKGCPELRSLVIGSECDYEPLKKLILAKKRTSRIKPFEIQLMFGVDWPKHEVDWAKRQPELKFEVLDNDYIDDQSEDIDNFEDDGNDMDLFFDGTNWYHLQTSNQTVGLVQQDQEDNPAEDPGLASEQSNIPLAPFPVPNPPQTTLSYIPETSAPEPEEKFKESSDEDFGSIRRRRAKRRLKKLPTRDQMRYQDSDSNSSDPYEDDVAPWAFNDDD